MNQIPVIHGTDSIHTVLTIAGSDCSGGAGIQADLKTMSAFGVYGMSVITAVTAQNTTGVYGISQIPAEMIGKQLDCIFTDIRPEAVKIGMLGEVSAVEIVAEKLRQYQAKNIILDPVMISTSGRRLLNEDAMSALTEHLMPLASLITPNIPETEVLTGLSIRNRQDMEAAAKLLCETYQAVLVKGGHRTGSADDILCQKEFQTCEMERKVTWFSAQRIQNPNNHGTGCTLSSAIACGLAAGKSLEESVRQAKIYLGRALNFGLDLGKGNGPLNHMVHAEESFSHSIL
ncbi:MAG: bifunctional hydroxymethylpyrimidine kinase/phosphomethylpyrimidine kinase [bacterium]|nr:bifunctional hydroxymethylpyrimidine kinase/phosphomethylpyrimidine kinase [bacterium]